LDLVILDSEQVVMRVRMHDRGLEKRVPKTDEALLASTAEVTSRG